MLRDFDAPGASECNELDVGGPVSRGVNHLRELAIKAMLEGTSKDRIERALRSRTRPTAETLNMDVGSLVDFWRQPIHKDDNTGWIGPGKIVHIDGEGMIHVKFQGHIYPCGVRHVRNALTFFSLFCCCELAFPMGHLVPPEYRTQGTEARRHLGGFSGERFWLQMQQHIRSLDAGKPYLLSAVQGENGKWLLTKHAKDSHERYCGLLH